ncbi:MAG: KEOPS complex subunit Pcc1 [Candidatus Micrarchaeota archaeon]
MNALFEVSFASEQLARTAKGVLTFAEISDKSSMELNVEKNVLKARIEAKNFASLRARSVSFLRDVKVFLDSVELVKKR